MTQQTPTVEYSLMMEIRRALEHNHQQIMEIGKIVHHDHQWCKLDEHNAKHSKTWQWKLECQWMWQLKPKQTLWCFIWVPSPKHYDAMETKACKTLLYCKLNSNCALLSTEQVLSYRTSGCTKLQKLILQACTRKRDQGTSSSKSSNSAKIFNLFEILCHGEELIWNDNQGM